MSLDESYPPSIAVNAAGYLGSGRLSFFGSFSYSLYHFYSHLLNQNKLEIRYILHVYCLSLRFEMYSQTSCSELSSTYETCQMIQQKVNLLEVI